MTQVHFAPPGPGVWELEQTHYSRPATRYAAAAFPDPLERGFGEGTRRYGLLLDTLVMRPVNDFIYSKFRIVGAPEDAKGPPPKLIFQVITRLHPEIRRRVAAGAQAISQKLWRQDLERWDTHYKPDSIARNQRLQQVRPESLSDQDLIAHLEAVLENAIEMVYRHHIFTISCIFPVGHYLAEMKDATGLPSSELLGLLKGSSPVSKGVALAELEEVTRALAENGVAADRFRGVAPHVALAELRGLPNGIGDAVERFVDAVGYRTVSGYDVSDMYALEMPEMLVRTLLSGVARAASPAPDGERLDRVRSRVPDSRRARFEELLEEARYVNRLRDERGIYNDMWGTGLARRALLEAGRRLHRNGVISDPALAVCATHDELVELLRGGKEPTTAELERRQTWRLTKTIADAPPFLGGEPSPPPPPEWLPVKARANARAVGTAIQELFGVSERKAKPRTVEGLPVHPGVYEGPARLVHGPGDFARLQRGDVLVTRSTAPAFNVVLPLLGAIVTDRGGQLSHAAIVAREYGIPAVVGTRDATTTFPDGARVRVDGDAGKVELLT